MDMWFMKQIITLKLDNPNSFRMVLIHLKDIYMVFDNILPVKNGFSTQLCLTRLEFVMITQFIDRRY